MRYLDFENTSPPIAFDLYDNTWGFWDEIWCNFYGGYKTLQLAEDALSVYALLI